MTKLLSQNVVLESKFFTVFENELEFDTGTKAVHNSVLRDPSVSVFPLDEKGNIYLVDQYRYLHKKRIVEAVAGMIENEEKPLDTAKKELREEAGIIAKKWCQLQIVKAAGSIISWDSILFLAQDLTFEQQHLEESEDIRVIKVPFSQAVKMAVDGTIETVSSVTGILLINTLLSQGDIRL